MKRICIVIFLIFGIVEVLLAENYKPVIEKVILDPDIVSLGDSVVISAKVNHPLGLDYIKKVGLVIYHGRWVSIYPFLYDDGTHGDKIAKDGIYSLRIKAEEESKEMKIVISVVDRDNNEVQSEPVILKILKIIDLRN